MAPAPPAQTQQPHYGGQLSRSTQPTRDSVARDNRPPRGARAPATPASARRTRRTTPTRRQWACRLATTIAPAETAAPRRGCPRYREVTIPAGTALPLADDLDRSPLNPRRSKRRSARSCSNAISIDGDTAIPAGAVLQRHGDRRRALGPRAGTCAYRVRVQRGRA